MVSVEWIVSTCFVINVFAGQIVSLSTVAFPKCHTKSGKPGYRLLVQHGQPLRFNDRNGLVLINASVIVTDRAYTLALKCSWTFEGGGEEIVKGSKCNDVSQYLKFSNAGLNEVTVTASFKSSEQESRIINCTVVNVSACSRQINLEITTSKELFNVSNNHTEVTLDKPGLVNFTVLVFHVFDPFYICHSLYYNWSFGDGQHSLLTKEKHFSHFYNSSGVFYMVLDILDEKNISVTVNVKEIPSPHDNSSEAAVGISLVLGVCFGCFIFLVCSGILLKKRHRFTEVAAFDFRHADFQSGNDGTCYQRSTGCFKKLVCRTGSEDRRLLVNEHRSNRRSLGILPTQELQSYHRV